MYINSDPIAEIVLRISSNLSCKLSPNGTEEKKCRNKFYVRSPACTVKGDNEKTKQADQRKSYFEIGKILCSSSFNLDKKSR